MIRSRWRGMRAWLRTTCSSTTTGPATLPATEPHYTLRRIIIIIILIYIYIIIHKDWTSNGAAPCVYSGFLDQRHCHPQHLHLQREGGRNPTRGSSNDPVQRDRRSVWGKDCQRRSSSPGSFKPKSYFHTFDFRFVKSGRRCKQIIWREQLSATTGLTILQRLDSGLTAVQVGWWSWSWRRWWSWWWW